MKVLHTVECCGFSFRVCEDGFLVDLRNGKTKTFTNARGAVIVFSEEIASYIADKLFALIAKFGYDKDTGERIEEVRK